MHKPKQGMHNVPAHPASGSPCAQVVDTRAGMQLRCFDVQMCPRAGSALAGRSETATPGHQAAIHPMRTRACLKAATALVAYRLAPQFAL